MTERPASTPTKQKQLSLSWVYLGICCVVFLLIACVAAVMTFLPSAPVKNQGADSAPTAVAEIALESLTWETERPDDYDPHAVTGSIPADIFPPNETEDQKDTFTFRINSRPCLSDGQLTNLYVENCLANNGSMTVTILSGDGSVLYQSGLLSPNQYLCDVPCDFKTDAPSIPAVAIIQAYSGLPGSQPVETFSQQIQIAVLH